MRDRLIELLYDNNVHCDQTIEGFVDDVLDIVGNCVTIPPCKVGDTVYKVVNDKRVKRPYECEVVGFWISKDETCNSIHLVRYINGVFDCSFSVPFTEFGKTLFSTKEEAEKALRGEGE